jgi:hypothetical protein
MLSLSGNFGYATLFLQKKVFDVNIYKLELYFAWTLASTILLLKENFRFN